MSHVLQTVEYLPLGGKHVDAYECVCVCVRVPTIPCLYG